MCKKKNKEISKYMKPSTAQSQFVNIISFIARVNHMGIYWKLRIFRIKLDHSFNAHWPSRRITLKCETINFVFSEDDATWCLMAPLAPLMIGALYTGIIDLIKVKLVAKHFWTFNKFSVFWYSAFRKYCGSFTFFTFYVAELY